jgi:hypothetical protein
MLLVPIESVLLLFHDFLQSLQQRPKGYSVPTQPDPQFFLFKYTWGNNIGSDPFEHLGD